MKKIVMSLLTIGIVGALIGGGVFAYFSDVETSEDNVFTAGTIDLSAPGILYVDLENLKPCQEGLLVLSLHNDGTNEMDIWKHLYGVVCDENGVVEPEAEYYIANEIDDPPGKNDIDEVMTYSLYVEIWDEEEPVDEYAIIDPEDGHIKVSEVECYWIYLGSLAPCETMIVIQDYHLQEEVGNWAQSDTMTFDIDFYAGQTNGPPPGTELEGFERD